MDIFNLTTEQKQHCEELINLFKANIKGVRNKSVGDQRILLRTHANNVIQKLKTESEKCYLCTLLGVEINLYQAISKL